MSAKQDSLHQIIYFSAANAVLTEDALLALLASSQRRNAERGITGLLLYSEGNIMQVIEGPSEAVQALFAKISIDPRHSKMIVARNAAIARRDFPTYKMGFKRVARRQMDTSLPGFSDMLERGGPSQLELAAMNRFVAVFLKTFVRTARIDRFGAA